MMNVEKHIQRTKKKQKDDNAQENMEFFIVFEVRKGDTTRLFIYVPDKQKPHSHSHLIVQVYPIM